MSLWSADQIATSVSLDLMTFSRQFFNFWPNVKITRYSVVNQQAVIGPNVKKKPFIVSFQVRPAWPQWSSNKNKQRGKLYLGDCPHRNQTTFKVRLWYYVNYSNRNNSLFPQIHLRPYQLGISFTLYWTSGQMISAKHQDSKTGLVLSNVDHFEQSSELIRKL